VSSGFGDDSRTHRTASFFWRAVRDSSDDVTKGATRDVLEDANVVEDAVEGGCDAAEAGRGMVLGLGRPEGRSSRPRPDVGRVDGADDSAFIASDLAGGLIVGMAAGAGLPGAERGAGALVGLTAGAEGGAREGATAAGAEAGAEAFALLMSGMMVALDAGLRFDVWSMT
jgi:hypothetical protein